jgi:hypothetical protein
MVFKTARRFILVRLISTMLIFIFGLNVAAFSQALPVQNIDSNASDITDKCAIFGNCPKVPVDPYFEPYCPDGIYRPLTNECMSIDDVWNDRQSEEFWCADGRIVYDPIKCLMEEWNDLADPETCFDECYPVCERECTPSMGEAPPFCIARCEARCIRRCGRN